MKFFVPNEAAIHLEEQDVKWICEAQFNQIRECFTLQEWANGWVIEADESFNLFFTILTGKQLPVITDQEYSQYILDKVAFLGKERAEQVRLSWAAWRELK